MSAAAAIGLCALGFVILMALVLGMCRLASDADDQSDECYRELLRQKEAEQKPTEPAPAPRRAGLRIVNH